MFPHPTAPRLFALLLPGAILVGGCGSTGSEAPVPGPDRPSAAAAALAEKRPEARTERIREDLVAREIQPGAWVITHERPLAANSLVVRAADGSVLLVDTPFTPDATRALLDWIDATLEPRSKRAVNTHFHLDALGGNAALRDAGVGAQGLVPTAELLRERGDIRRQELVEILEDPAEREEIASVEMVAPPSLYMAARYRQPLGSETFEIVFPGAAHSPDNVVVWLPERKLLFGGCMVKGGKSLGFLGDADLESWPTAIRQLQRLDPAIVVPGHGDRLDPGQLQHTLDLLEAAATPAEPIR